MNMMIKYIKANKEQSSTLWSSTQDLDWIYDATDDEIINIYAFDFWEIPLKSGDVVTITDETDVATIPPEDVDIDAMRRDIARSWDGETEFEYLTSTIIPEIEKQCAGNMIWAIGNYQRWDGGRRALGFYSDVEDGIKSLCYPEYDSSSALINDGGNLVFTESSHDAPMGGTAMTLYSFKDIASINAAEDYINEEYTEIDSEGIAHKIPEYWGYEASVDDLAEDFDAVDEWIQRGWLTPIDANAILI